MTSLNPSVSPALDPETLQPNVQPEYISILCLRVPDFAFYYRRPPTTSRNPIPIIYQFSCIKSPDQKGGRACAAVPGSSWGGAIPGVGPWLL